MTNSASNMPRKTVALVDWLVRGHHATYMRMFARTLLDAGFNVIALSPEPDAFMSFMKAQQSSASPNAGKFTAAYFHRPHYPLWPRSFRYWAEAKASASSIKKALQDCENTIGQKCDFVFFNSLYEKLAWLMEALADACDRPWSFLYLHTTSLPPHTGKAPGVLKLLQHPKLKAFGALDERIIGPGETLTGKKILQFSDITNEAFDPAHPLEKELRAFKGDAPLILSIGYLHKTKGFTTLLETASDPKAAHLKFAFIGECKLQKLNRHERQVIKKLKASNPNVLFRFGRVADGAEYNACIRAADVIFAAYHDFAHSSNTLTKAAIFEKPVIVSEGHLMAERTRKYRFGEVVPQKDPESTLTGIHKIVDDPRTWTQLHNPDWAGYRALHSQSYLHSAFNRLFAAYEA